MEEVFKDALATIGLLCEGVVGLCIAVGAVEALFHAVFRGGVATARAKRATWIRFAGWILLALEFALAADIVGTALAPTWNAIGQLAVIATIRTALNFFLARDIKEFAETQQPGAAERA